MNISADHLVCDLSTFDSMAQRFGRVNRFGDCDDTQHRRRVPEEVRRRTTTSKPAGEDARLAGAAERRRQPGRPRRTRPGGPRRRVRPPPTILPTSDILFDAWALTTIRGKLPGRPLVEPYLHGISE